MQEGIGGCREQKEPGHGGLSTHETFILWLKFNSLNHFFFSHGKVYPPPMQEGNCWAWRGGGGGNVPCIPHPWIRPCCLVGFYVI